MENKKIIRAADFLPKPNNDSDGEDFALPTSDQMLLNLFGEMPNYSNQRFEELWQEVFDADDADMIAYCREQGVDILGDRDVPVDGWLDIAVMLKAIERGLLTLEVKADEN